MPSTLSSDHVPDLSILIVTYNSAQVIADCLRSLQNESSSIEIVVIDNKSEDETTEIVKGSFPNVYLITSPTNLGFAKANNLGFQVAHGRFIMLLNPDTQVQAEALATLIKFGELHPKAGIIGPRLVNSDGSLQHSTVRFPDYRQALYWFIERLNPEYDSTKNGRYSSEEYTRIHDVDVILGAATLVRREVWEELHGLDETFDFYFEDTDLCFRAKKAGWALLYTPNATITHIGKHSTATNPENSKLVFARSQTYFYRKNYGFRGYIILKLIRIVGLIYWLARLFRQSFRGETSLGVVPKRLKFYVSILFA